MITAVHTLVYAEDPGAARGFFRDVLGMPATDTGHTGSTDQRFDISLMCDDLEATMSELAAKGAEFDGDIQEQPWGMTVPLKVPGAGAMTLYQPTYDPPATSL